MKEGISGVKGKIHEMYSSLKENVKNNPDTRHPGNLGHYEKIKSMNRLRIKYRNIIRNKRGIEEGEVSFNWGGARGHIQTHLNNTLLLNGDSEFYKF